MHSPDADLKLAHAMADAARAVIMPHFRTSHAVENKSDVAFDPVTVADRAAEAAMREILAAERPDDGIYGEEFEPVSGTSGRTWVLDPIDGTRGFMMGLPTWGVLIALHAETGGIGMMDQPATGDRFWASGRAMLRDGNGERAIATRRCEGIGTAIMATTSPRLFPDEATMQRVEALADHARMIRYGTDCWGYALLAAGLVDIVVETGLKPFDIAPFVPLVRAAGGAITDFSGEDFGPRLLKGYNGEAVAVGDPSLLPAVLDALQ